MAWNHRSLARLRDVLAGFYPTRQDSERVVADAGLEAGMIAFNDKAILNWFSILEESSRLGAVDAIFEVVAGEYPDNADLESCRSASGDGLGEENGSGVPVGGEPVSTGLAALSDLLAEEEVRQAVVAFRIRFEDASKQIEVVANYKDLHDLLHTLQLHCYDRIVQESRNFPDDELAGENLADYEQTLINLIEDMREVGARESIGDGEVRWIDESLERARESLRAALEEENPTLLKRAASLINRVLAIQPSLINTRLNDGARALRLPDLVETLKVILDKILAGSADEEADEEKIASFGEGVVALVKLHDNLAALVADHDGWQRMDEELRRISALVAQDTSELELSWPDLEGWLEPLCEASPRDWVERFKADCDRLAEGLANHDEIQIRRFFRRFRRHTIDRFYRVDLSLKKQCDELRKVVAPLASVLEVAQ